MNVVAESYICKDWLQNNKIINDLVSDYWCSLSWRNSKKNFLILQTLSQQTFEMHKGGMASPE